MSVWCVECGFRCMYAWSARRSCVACHVDLVAMCELENDMPEEIG